MLRVSIEARHVYSYFNKSSNLDLMQSSGWSWHVHFDNLDSLDIIKTYLPKQLKQIYQEFVCFVIRVWGLRVLNVFVSPPSQHSQHKHLNVTSY